MTRHLNILQKWAAFFVAFFLYSNTLSAIHKSYFIKIDPSVKMIKTGHFDFKTKQILVFDSLFNQENGRKEAAQFLEKCISETGKTAPSVLIFIHGMWGNKPRYLNDNALDFEADYANEGQNNVIIHLIWQGDAVIYRKNERQAAASAEQMAAILNGFLSVKNVSLKLMCHSMGNFLFTKTIDKLNGNGQIFDKMLLLAPDVDAAFFNTQLPKLKTLTNEIDIFYHRKDLFLRYSAFIHKGKRLGQFADNQGVVKIKTFDCTAFRNTSIAGKFSRHLYFKTSIDTRKIIQSLM
jgi:esterase/lipase superfamily enzyme